MKKIIFYGFIAVFGLCFAGIGAVIYISGTPRKVAEPLPMPESGKITVQNAAPLFYDSLPADYYVVDVRTPKEYEQTHTEGVVNIPVALFEENGACETIVPRLPKGKKVIFVCPLGPRAEEMFYNLTDSKEDGGCGIEPDGLYYLTAKVKYGKKKLILR